MILPWRRRRRPAGSAPPPPPPPGGSAALDPIRWHKDRTLTNIGTAYVNAYVGLNGEQQLVDFTGSTQGRVRYHVNKVGTGTQSWRLLEANGTDVLAEISDAGAAGEKELDSGWVALPAWATGEKNVRPQGKSTTGTDDPVFRGAALYVKA